MWPWHSWLPTRSRIWSPDLIQQWEYDLAFNSKQNVVTLRAERHCGNFQGHRFLTIIVEFMLSTAFLLMLSCPGVTSLLEKSYVPVSVTSACFHPSGLPYWQLTVTLMKTPIRSIRKEGLMIQWLRVTTVTHQNQLPKTVLQDLLCIWRVEATS